MIAATGIPQPLPEGRFAGRVAFTALVRSALACAAREGWSSLLLSDADFADWPLGEREVIDSLNAWAGRGRHLRLLAQDFAPLRRLHPRFVQWRTTWSHIVEAQAWPTAPVGDVPSAICGVAWSMERLDPLRSAGISGADAGRRVALLERIEMAWSRGGPGFPPTTLGL